MTQLAFLSKTEPRALANLKNREQYREQYWHKRDPILNDRLLWRAHTFRHLVHLLPHQTILELGAGQGAFTRQLLHVSRGENLITSVTFNSDYSCPEELSASVEWLNPSTFSDSLAGRSFDFVVVMELLDKNNYARLFQDVYELLKPGGQIVFYESNPWNVLLKLRRGLSRLFGQKDPRQLLNRPQLYELISELGFIRVFAVFNDFVYAPLTPSCAWLLRNLSILLENTPGIQTLAGSILLHAQKPPRLVEHPQISLCDHKQFHKAISVVIPCHNEEMNIKPLVTELKFFFNDYIHEIIPIDDNSTDKTSEVIQKLAQEDPRIKPVLRSPPNGVGRAIADGCRVATGKYILSMDCDFQHLLPEIRDLFDAAAEGYDVVVGSRFSRYSVLLNYPFAKIFVNRGFHALAQILFRRRFRDLTNNLKLMRREIVEKLQLTQPGFAVNAETGLQPLLLGYSVKEVPISWINRTPDMGISSFRLAKVGGSYLQVLFRLWLKTVFGIERNSGFTLSKIIQSVTLRQWHSLKNRLFRPDNKKIKYNRFHSQFGEDRYIYENINLPKNGVFVDVGAGHPSYLSNTYFFEKNGWTGVCIDADPKQYKFLKKERTTVEWAAIAAEEGEIEFSQAYFPTYSSTVRKKQNKELIQIGFKKTIRVPSLKLETILEKHNIGIIDLLDIDVEGTELDVWQTFDYEKHKPKVVIIEYYTFGLADNSQNIKDFFSKLPYKLVHITCTNLIFLNLAL